MKRVRVMLIVALAAAGPAGAASAGLNQAIQLHQRGDFEHAREALTRFAADTTLSPDDHLTAVEYLASCQLQLEDRAGAKATLKELLRQQPNAHLDPDLFFPELIALAEQARIELSAQTPVVVPEAPVENPPSSGAARRWSKLPLIGGLVLGVAAALLEGVAYLEWQDLRGPMPLSDPTPYQTTGRALQTSAQVTALIAAAALLTGVLMFLLGQ